RRRGAAGGVGPRAVAVDRIAVEVCADQQVLHRRLVLDRALQALRVSLARIQDEPGGQAGREGAKADVAGSEEAGEESVSSFQHVRDSSLLKAERQGSGRLAGG